MAQLAAQLALVPEPVASCFYVLKRGNKRVAKRGDLSPAIDLLLALRSTGHADTNTVIHCPPKGKKAQ